MLVLINKTKILRKNSFFYSSSEEASSTLLKDMNVIDRPLWFYISPIFLMSNIPCLNIVVMKRINKSEKLKLNPSSLTDG